jgi:Flp pilus assembly pilin Flp
MKRRLDSFERRASALARDTRGAVLVEYAVVIGGVAFAGAVGLIVVGTAVAENFEFVRSMLLCPIP